MVHFGHYYSQEFAVLEADNLETAIIDSDVRKIAVNEFTFGKHGAAEFAFGKIAFFEQAIGKFFSAQVFLGHRKIVEFLLLVNVGNWIHIFFHILVFVPARFSIPKRLMCRRDYP
jgi:hypothetical protein